MYLDNHALSVLRQIHVRTMISTSGRRRRKSSSEQWHWRVSMTLASISTRKAASGVSLYVYSSNMMRSSASVAASKQNYGNCCNMT